MGAESQPVSGSVKNRRLWECLLGLSVLLGLYLVVSFISLLFRIPEIKQELAAIDASGPSVVLGLVVNTFLSMVLLFVSYLGIRYSLGKINPKRHWKRNIFQVRLDEIYRAEKLSVRNLSAQESDIEYADYTDRELVTAYKNINRDVAGKNFIAMLYIIKARVEKLKELEECFMEKPEGQGQEAKH